MDGCPFECAKDRGWSYKMQKENSLMYLELNQADSRRSLKVWQNGEKIIRRVC